MDHRTDEHGEHLFRKEFEAEPGSRIVYKFRIGPGDWWVLDENAPTAVDSAGISNNELEVLSPEQQVQKPNPAGVDKC